MAPIAEAVVEIVPDTKAFDKQLTTDLKKSMTKAEKVVGSAAQGIESEFKGIGADAAKTGAKIETEFAEAFRDVNGRLRDSRGKFIKEGEQIEGVFREIGTAADKASSKMDLDRGGAASGGIKRLLVAGGAAFAIHGLTSALRNATTAAAESARIGRLTEQVIKTTGGAAGVSADQIGDLATKLSGLTGVDDEVIQSASNVLLTFKSVQNAGEGQAAIFDRAQVAALDLSAVLGTDLSGATLQLGKALNDPIKGVSALGRAGVQFTQQQKDQIATLVESGDVLGAQQIILKEVESQVGGAAAAAADPMARLSVIIGNLQESLGAGLVAAVAPAADALAGLAPAIEPAVAALGGAFGAIINNVATTFGALAPVIGEALTTITPLIESFGPLLGSIANSFAPLITMFAETAGTLGPPIVNALSEIAFAVTPLIEVFAQFGGEMAVALLPVFQTLADIAMEVAPIISALVPPFSELASVVAGALGDAMMVLAPIIADISATLGGVLATALPLIADAFLSVAEALAPLLPLFAELVGGVLKSLEPVLPMIVDGIVQLAEGFAELVPPIVSLVTDAFERLQPYLPRIIDLAVELADMLIGGLVDAVLALAEAFVPLVEEVAPLIDELMPALLDVFEQLKPEMPALVDAFVAIAASVAELVVALLPLLPPLTELVVLLIQKIGAPLIAGIATQVARLAEGFSLAVGAIAEFINRTGAAFTNLVNLLPGFLEAFERGKERVREIVAGIVDFFVKLPGRIVTALSTLGAKVVDVVSRALSRAVSTVRTKIAEIVAFFTGLPGRIVSALASLGSSLLGALGSAFSTALTAATGFVDDVVAAITGLPGRLATAVAGIAGALADIGSSIINGIIDGITNAVDFIGDIGRTIFNTLIDFINDNFIDTINSAAETFVDGLPIPGDQSAPDLPHIPHLARGGVISGPTLALIGESRATIPEIVTPEALMRQIVRQELALVTAGGGAGSVEQTFNITTIGADPEVVAQKVANRSARRARR